MSSWHNRLKRRRNKATQSAQRRYIFTDGTVILDDQKAVMRKVAACGYDISYRVERLHI